MIKVNAIGDACPIPVVKTKNAIKELNGPGTVEVLVDNEIAVQNLTKMAVQKGYEIQSQKLEEQKYQVIMTVGEGGEGMEKQEDTAEETVCIPDSRNHKIVVISSGRMGEGNDELGHVLMKSFIFAVTQLDELPKKMVFYNGGAKLTVEDSPALEDLKSLAEQGVEIMTCGTCLDYYGLKDKLAVGTVTNMYSIVETMQKAGRIIRP